MIKDKKKEREVWVYGLTSVLVISLVLIFGSLVYAFPHGVAAGGGHTVGLKLDGTVLAVGRSTEGQLGVGSWNNVVQVDAGQLHTVGLKADGTVVAVGRDLVGGNWTVA